MGQFALSLVARHFPQPAVPLYQGTPWCVLLENSDHESEAHARAQFESLLEAALEQGCVTDAVVAESLTQARQLWQIRENIPLAQAQEGLNVKHDISVPISRIPEFVRHADALLQQAMPGRAPGELRPPGRRQPALQRAGPRRRRRAGLPAQHEEAINTLVFDAVDHFAGSISAEHGVGSLKIDKLHAAQVDRWRWT
jgi:FAD/FMN-containing dehydrogenase